MGIRTTSLQTLNITRVAAVILALVTCICLSRSQAGATEITLVQDNAYPPYMSEQDGSDNENEKRVTKFQELMNIQIQTYCNNHECDFESFKDFLCTNLISVLRFIIHDEPISPVITNNVQFESVYQFIYEIYTEVFDTDEHEEITDEDIDTIKIY